MSLANIEKIGSQPSGLWIPQLSELQNAGQSIMWIIFLESGCSPIVRVEPGRRSREVHAVAGDNRRYLVALPGIEPGF